MDAQEDDCDEADADEGKIHFLQILWNSCFFKLVHWGFYLGEDGSVRDSEDSNSSSSEGSEDSSESHSDDDDDDDEDDEEDEEERERQEENER